MAASRGGTIEFSCSKYKYWKGTIEWYYSQDQFDNSTTIDCVVSTQITDGTELYAGGKNFIGAITIANYTDSFNYKKETSGLTVRGNKFTTTIRHKPNGYAPDCVITCTVIAPSVEGWDISAAQLTITANIGKQIPRIPTDSEFSEIGETIFGGKVHIGWKPKSADHHFKLKFTFEGRSKDTNPISPGTTNEYVYTGFTIPKDWAKDISNSAVGYVLVTLTSYANKECTIPHPDYTTSKATFEVKIPNTSEFIPEIKDIIASTDNSGTSIPESWKDENGNDVVSVAKHSKIRIRAAGTGKYGAKIRSFNLSGSYSGTIYSPDYDDVNKCYTLDLTTETFTSGGDKVFSISCTDTRGITSNISTSNTISIFSNPDPEVTKFFADKNIDKETGEVSISVKTDWEIAEIDGKNSATAILKIKENSEDGAWIDYSEDDGATPFQLGKDTSVPLKLAFDKDTSYYFKVVVTDALGQVAEREIFVSSNEVLLDFPVGGNGLGIGKVCDANVGGLEVNFKATFYNDVVIKGETVDKIIERHKKPLRCLKITLSVADWRSSANNDGPPYIASYRIDGVTEDHNFGPPFLYGIENLSALKIANRNLRRISYGKTGNGTITFTCLEERPTGDLDVMLQGSEVWEPEIEVEGE